VEFQDLRQRRVGLTAVVAFVAPLAVAALLVPFRDSFANSAAALTMVAVVTAMAVVGNRLAGVIASLSAALWFDFFLTRPYDTFDISHRADIEAFVAVIVVGLFITELAGRSRHHWQAAANSVAHVAMIHEVAELAVTQAPETEIIDRTASFLTTLLSLRSCRFDPALEDPPLARIESNGDVIHVSMNWPAREIGIPGPQAEIVAQWRGRVAGRFVLTPTPGRPVSVEQRIVAVALVDVAAAAIMDRRHAL
jgi:K+-sensing histidine kinase KdpD